MLSTLLDVMLGLIYIYTFFSLICSTVLESLAQTLRLRAKVLRDSVPKLLGSATAAGGSVAAEIHQHPLIQGIELRPPYPTYIPPKQFAMALIDVAVNVGAAPPLSVRAKTRGGFALTASETSLVRSLIGDGMSLQVAQTNIEKWFEDSMERVAGAYKRKVSKYLFTIALAVSFGFGLDTLQIVRDLYNNQPVRQSLAAAAQSAAARVTAPAFPVTGPQHVDVPYIFGCVLTAILLSLGAPFWFDLLGKLANLRKTGVPPDMKGKIIAQ
jgi:hypothetical protein